MKKIGIFISVLTASLMLSALPAFSAGTGPYGSFGPTFAAMPGGEVQHVALASGTGPYGSYGPVLASVPGAELQHVAFSSGTGPYGSFGPAGMSKEWGETHQMANKDECLLVAMNCPKDMTIQEKIDRLQGEIAKGTSVYTPEELNTLKHELNDAYKEQGRGY